MPLKRNYSNQMVWEKDYNIEKDVLARNQDA